MLHQITWAQYTEAIALLLLGYYFVIGLKFYGADLKQLLTPKRKPAALPADDYIEEEADEDLQEQNHDFSAEAYVPGEEETDQLLQQAEELSPKLKEAIALAAEKKYTQAAFIFSLQKLLKQYPSLNIPAYRAAINNLVVSECDKQGGLHPDADELAMMWKE